LANEYPNFDGSQICAQTEPDLWFPTADRQTGRLAKTLCLTCPWLKPCLDYALKNDVVGIWGGKTERERSHIRKKLKIKPEPLYLDTLFAPSLRGKVAVGRYNESVSEVVDV
jgi:hypothetical protein